MSEVEMQVIDWVYVVACAAPLLWALLASRNDPRKDARTADGKKANRTASVIPVEFSESDVSQRTSTETQVCHKLIYLF